MSPPKQYTYSFISGKNWKLSLAELAAYFKPRLCDFEVSEFSRSFFILKTDNPLEASAIDDLGGTLKIAAPLTFVSNELFAEVFLKANKKTKEQLKMALPLDILAEKMPSASSGKAVFGVSVYWAEPPFRPVASAIQRFLGSAMKDELKAQGKKARFMGFPRNRPQPQLTAVEVLKKGLVESHAEILLCIGKREASVGATFAVHNPFEFQKRDVEKPVQRKIFAIPPRVARIMVNLTHCTRGKTFLDPFCGVGTILQEALLAEAKVIGLDINRWCVEGARRNLEWLRQEYSLRNANYAAFQGDARNLRSKIREEIDCIASEPDLGPALRDIPTTPYAEKIIVKLSPLFADFLSEAYEVLRTGGRLAVVTPYIKTRSGKPVTMGIKQMAEDVGFETVKPFQQVHFEEPEAVEPMKQMVSLVDVDEKHIVGREIHVFRKS